MATLVREVIQKAYNNVWASDTPNKLDISEEDGSKGILYQSLVVSNQVNGALYDITNTLRALQLTGGYFVMGQKYYLGHIAALNVIEDPKYPPTLRFFECINDNNGAGIQDVLPYKTVQQIHNNNGITSYTVNNVDLNTTYWRMMNGSEAYLKAWLEESINLLREWVSKEIQTLKDDIKKQFEDFKNETNQKIEDLKIYVDNKVDEITDVWTNLGTITSGFSLNFAAYDGSNCFVANVNNNVALGTCSWAGATEKSGCFLVNNGAGGITQFFTNVYTSVRLPIQNPPENSFNGGKLWFFYKLHPVYGVCFTIG